MKRGLVLLSLLLILFSNSADCQTVIVAGNDTTICLGGNANLTGTVVSGSYGTTSYTFEVIPYQPESFVGGTPVQFAANQDDQIAGPFDIGFDFCFFNQIYTQFYIGSNGWVGFSYETAWTTFTAQAIPTTNPVVPKNCIMAPWQDWWPGWTPAGTNGTNVYYYVTGTAPNRKLVVYWIHCPLYNCTGDVTKRGTFQIVMNEQNSIVENHIESKPNCSNSENATQGVHNIDGTVAFTAVGRNCTPWTTTNESTRFVPSGIRWYTGGYPGGNIVGYGENITVTPNTTTTYTVAVESCAGGTATDDVTSVCGRRHLCLFIANLLCNGSGPGAHPSPKRRIFLSYPCRVEFYQHYNGENKPVIKPSGNIPYHQDHHNSLHGQLRSP